MPKLNKRVVDALRPNPDGKDVFVWDAGDGALKGFGIRIKPSGAASYFVQYRNKEGRTRRLVLGKLGTLTPDQARKLAAEALRAVAEGDDPSAERRAIRGAISVADLCDLYLADARGRIKNSTLAMDMSSHRDARQAASWASDGAEPDGGRIERMKADIIAGKTQDPATDVAVMRPVALPLLPARWGCWGQSSNTPERLSR